MADGSYLRRILVLAFVCLLLVGGRGAAQVPDTTVVPLDSVLVEALRTATSLERAPFAATVVQRSEAERARPGRGLDEMLARVPGVQVDNRFNYAVGERISIRGFGARAQFGVRGVRVVVDGVPATFADGQSAVDAIDPAEVDRAEILRGTASSLYGNAAGGVVLLRAARPAAAPWNAHGRVMVGGDGFRQTRVGAGGTLGSVAYSLRHSLLAWEGFREHSEAWRSQTAAQLHLPALSGDLSFDVRRLAFDASNPGSLTGEAWRETPDAAFPFNVAQGAGKDGVQTQGGARWRRHAGPGDIDLSAYLIRRDITNPITTTVIDLDRSAGGVRALYHAAVGTVRTVAGADVDWQADDRLNHTNVGSARGDRVLDQFETVHAVAPFARIELDLGRETLLSAGLRYDRVRFEVDDRRAAPDADASGVRLMDAWSPTMGVVSQVARGVSVFGSWSFAFETPTTTELANRPDAVGGFNPDLEPQLARTLEGGVRLPGTRMEAEVVLYRTDVRNSLVPFEVAGAPGRNFFRNAGRALHRGAEASVRVAPTIALSIEAGYTLTDARFLQFEVGERDFSGNRVPGVATHRAFGLLRWAGDLVDVGVEGHVSGEVPVDDSNTEWAPAHLLINVDVAPRFVQVGGARLRPLLSVTNLLDRRYVASVVPNAFGGRFYEPGPGRRIYLGLEGEIGPR